MRNLLLKLFGLKTYVTNLQLANEHLASKNLNQAAVINNLEHSLNEQKENAKKLYDAMQHSDDEVVKLNGKLSERYTELVRLENMKKALESTNKDICQRLQQLTIDNEQLTNENHALTEKVVHYKTKLHTANSRVGALTTKLRKYEQA